MADINQLPYFQINPVRDLSLNGTNNTKETNIIARFLLKKIRKLLKEKYVSKKRHISKKKAKTKVNTCKQRINFQWQELEKKGHYYKQKAILKQLQELTKNVKQIKNKLRVIDKKLK